MNALKGVGSVLAGIVVLLVMLALLAVFLKGAEWVSNNLVGYALILSTWLLAACLLILLPLSLFQMTRIVPVFGFLISSHVFGITIAMAAFLSTLHYWGVPGVLAGLLFMGVGIVPVGILASLFNSNFAGAGLLTFGGLLSIGSRLFAFWLAAKADAVEHARRMKMIEGEVLR